MDANDQMAVLLNAAHYDMSRAVMKVESEKLTLDDVREIRSILAAASNKLIQLETVMLPLVIEHRKKNENTNET